MKTQIFSIEGNRQFLDGGSMFGNAPRAVWEKWITPDDRDRIPLACRSLLIETPKYKILCETGIGAFFEPKLADRFGVQNADEHLLLKGLEERGIKEDDIDFVILSHLHFDHAGGLLPTYKQIQNGNDRLLFPKAKYVVGKEAWERALSPHSRDKASFIPGMTEKLLASGRLLIVEGEVDDRLPEEISFFISNGHTPGQMHTVFKGEKNTICFAGDLIPGKAWVHLPITMGYDRFPELLIDEKQKLYNTAVPEDWIIFFTHDPYLPASRIQLDEKGRYQTKDELKELERFVL